MTAAARILVFTDGAAKGNPGPGGWGAIVARADTVVELGGGDPHTTNNRMEMTAPIEALSLLGDHAAPVDLYTDSTYVIRGVTQWIHGWRRRGWKTAEGKDVLNRALWERLAQLDRKRAALGGICWHYVPGHCGIPGNERVDEIASGFASGAPPHLYRGPRAAYGVDLASLPADTAPPAQRPRNAASKSKAHSYVSVVNDRPMRHATWAECERRVRGVSGARFKKTSSRDDEAAVLRAWGFAPGDVE
jgi:ribonuclease HI